ncbi:MAG: ABC transporter ATP-binding protein/permease [Oscillospiraceae bacterium]|nr:ABC transporter ATP-binding protein/permease [Oscillospiraceae bacterium]
MNFQDRPLRIFLRYIGRQKKLFAIDMSCALLVAVIDLVFPYVSRLAMRSYLPEKLFRVFFLVMGAMALAYLLKALLYYVITVLGHRMGVLIEADMRRDLFTHLQTLSFRFYDRNRTGVLMSRLTSELFDITELSHHGPENIIICSLTIVGSLTVMFFLQPQLALVLTVVLPLCLWFTLSQRLRMKRANIEVKRKTAEITAAVESSISGVRVAKAFANEEQESLKFDRANALFKNAKTGYYRTMGLFMSGMEFTTGIAQVVVITVGGLLIMAGRMDAVDLITFSLYVSAFITPVRKLSQFAEQYMQGSAGFTRFLEIMRTEPEIRDAPDAKPLENVRGEVEFRDLSFDYGNGLPVLSHIDLRVPAGGTLALVGPSGGGKTSLCHLLPRFYEVTGGAVLVDGQDVRTLTQASLRRNIGILQQDVFLFADTIRENIRYGRPDASDEEIVEAAKRAEIHDEIMALPQGYDSFVGERGVMLSGGQKQRISIARVFLKNPRILVLDEATSALDTVTEQRIQAAMEALSRGRTTIVVAHRLSTVRHADQIAVIDGSVVCELGSHEELLAKNGVYASLCRAQSLG